MTETNRDIAQKTQDKFEWYFLALIFTVLSLSIQTAKLGVSFGADIFEVLGWISLLISGISGLSRIENIPSQYVAFDYEETVSQQRREVQKAAMVDDKIFDVSVGKDRPIRQVVKELDAKAAVIDKSSKRVARTLALKYRVER